MQGAQRQCTTTPLQRTASRQLFFSMHFVYLLNAASSVVCRVCRSVLGTVTAPKVQACMLSLQTEHVFPLAGWVLLLPVHLCKRGTAPDLEKVKLRCPNLFWRLYNSQIKLNERAFFQHSNGFVKPTKLNQAQQMDPIIGPKRASGFRCRVSLLAVTNQLVFRPAHAPNPLRNPPRGSCAPCRP